MTGYLVYIHTQTIYSKLWFCMGWGWGVTKSLITLRVTGGNSKKRRRGGKVAANWACIVHAKPLIYAVSMETVFTFRDASDCLFAVVLCQAYPATCIIGSGHPSTLPEHHLLIGLNGGLIQTRGGLNGRLWCYCICTWCCWWPLWSSISSWGTIAYSVTVAHTACHQNNKDQSWSSDAQGDDSKYSKPLSWFTWKYWSQQTSINTYI